MRGVLFLVFLLFVCLLTVNGQSVVIIEPVKDHEIEVGIVVIPGAQLRGESYQPLAETIQRESPLRVWVALTTNYTEDMPNPPQVLTAIPMALDDLHDAGMPEDTPVYFAGHSLGGTVLQMYVNQYPSKARGMMLWASFLLDTDSLAHYPVPVMHLSGDLDGQVRITTIAKTFRELESIIEEDANAFATRPVVVVEGVNHFQFSSGEKPYLVEIGDMQADVSDTEAWTSLALVVKDFIAYNLGFDTIGSFSRLSSYFQQTQDKIAPLTALKELEWNGTSCTWAKKSQELVASLPIDLSTPVTIYSVGYTDHQAFEASKPSVVKGSDDIAVITTRSTVAPNPSSELSTFMDSAFEIAVKMKNQEAVSRIVREDGYGNSSTCRGINEAALAYAYNAAPEVVKTRYDTRGRQMTFGADQINFTGSDWVDSHVKYESGADGTLLVTSSSLYTSPDFPRAKLAGMYYCKLMSPYRALEWIYIDSLRDIRSDA